MESIKTKLARLPKKPGVYFFKNASGAVIYIGKAVILRTRVRQYFLKTSDTSPKTEALRAAIRDVRWQECESEVDALIEEAKLIKKYKPRFNVIFRDDKQYAYACVTDEKPYPRLFITHQPRKVKMVNVAYQKCVGPFTDSSALRATVRLLRSIYPYCISRPGTLKRAPLEAARARSAPLPRTGRACFDYHIGRCTGVCADPTKQTETKRNITMIVNILSGKRRTILARLKRSMKVAAKAEHFLKADEYKRQIEKLESVFSHSLWLEPERIKRPDEWPEVESALKSFLGTQKPIRRVECYDISNISGTNAVGSMVVFENGKPNKSQYRKFRIKYSGETPNDPKMMAEVLSRRLNHPEWPKPDLIILDGGKGQLSMVGEVLPKSQLVCALAKEQEELYLPDTSLPTRAESLGRPVLFFVQRIRDEAHRFAVLYHRKLRGKGALV